MVKMDETSKRKPAPKLMWCGMKPQAYIFIFTRVSKIKALLCPAQVTSNESLLAADITWEACRTQSVSNPLH